MADPLSPAGSITVLSGVTLAGMLAGIDPGVIIAAFAGSVVFVLSATEFPVWHRLVLFCVSLFAGVAYAEFAAGIATSFLTTIIEDPIPVPSAIGSLLVSTAAVRFLMFLAVKPIEGETFIDRFRGRK